MREHMPASVGLIYPHQLSRSNPVRRCAVVWLVEDPLFFAQYPFHRQKLMLHRASMKHLEASLRAAGRQVRYVECGELKRSSDIGALAHAAGYRSICVTDPSDDWLSRELESGCRAAGVALEALPDPDFLTPPEVIAAWGERKRLFFTEFYIEQRKRLGILLDRGEPVGGSWTFDTENRKRLPKGHECPKVWLPPEDTVAAEARRYVEAHFPGAPGRAGPLRYPADEAGARRAFGDFLDHRLSLFGDYEDAISARETTLYHSLLTPALNIGLLTPAEIVAAALKCEPAAPINSLEGFIRQVIGWREYMRLVYLTAGRKQRTRNYLGNSRPLPRQFYTGTTGIDPIDVVIRRVVDGAYCHHIERLMVLGNFMLLCDLDPDAVYQWFMELFIDAYDWVMVPNVYGMSQYAAGPHITTKPYLSGSNYILKMSDLQKGPWCPVWDGLYWRFIHRHREWIGKNPRLGMAVRTFDRMGSKGAAHVRVAEEFLESLG